MHNISYRAAARGKTNKEAEDEEKGSRLTLANVRSILSSQLQSYTLEASSSGSSGRHLDSLAVGDRSGERDERDERVRDDKVHLRRRKMKNLYSDQT
jgi:hypothetical protein